MSDAYYIIDFDSTFVQIETLEELARIALKNNPNRRSIITRLEEITKFGMDGKLAFHESLEQRLKLFSANKRHVLDLSSVLKKKVTPSMKRNKAFFRKYHRQIYILSGGFKDYMIDLFKSFGLAQNHILANTFTYDKKGNVTGYDRANPLSRNGGKIKTLEKLHLDGKIYVIGDGYTDYELKKSENVKRFFVFCENVRREAVVEKADYVLPNFDEFLYKYNLPRAYSYPKSRIKVLLLENNDPRTVDMFKKEGYQVEQVKERLTEDTLIKRIKDVSIIVIGPETHISNRILTKAKRLLAIGAYTLRINTIDLVSAGRWGVVVYKSTQSPRKIVAFINTGSTMGAVNFPHVRLPKLKNSHRLIHTHENKPGVLASINGILGKNNINIEGQYLKTNEYVGYVITDVGKKYNPNIIEELRKVPGTIKLRVLY